ncbi:MAG: membrane dipeptidase [Bacteroidota bacterium]
MKNFIIDLHCHSQMKAYSHSFKADGPSYVNAIDRRKKNSVWRTDWPTASDLHKNINGLLGLTQFTQADILTCIKANVGVTFSSIYPLERSFTRPLNHQGKIADAVVNKITQFGKGRIDFIQDIEDYFPDLEQEYKFQLAHSGKVKVIDGVPYSYQFVRNYDELIHLLGPTKDEVRRMAVINSIEGAHCFGTGLEPFNLSERIDEVLNRIRIVKQEWEFPPFFITLAHHFYNEICGHAKSLELASLLLNQKKGLNSGFTTEGERILHYLLDDANGPRILIDLKHMSLAARKRYYEIQQEKYQYSIPIIVSHGCVTGYHDHIEGKDQPLVVAGAPHKKFNTADINFYDFELLNIKKSGGIFGIQFDERRIGSKSEKRKVKRAVPLEIPLHSAKLVWNQIQHIAEVLDQNGYFAWDIQSIGSDFDGIINPIDGFFSAMHFENLAHFLRIHAEQYCQEQMPHRIKHNFNQIGAEEIVERFFQLNALQFLQKHFRRNPDIVAHKDLVKQNG